MRSTRIVLSTICIALALGLSMARAYAENLLKNPGLQEVTPARTPSLRLPQKILGVQVSLEESYA